MLEVIYICKREKVGLYKPDRNTRDHVFKTKIKCIAVAVDT